MIAILAILAFALSLVEVEAVTGPVNRISITDAVERELRGDLAVPAHKVDVLTTDGVVTLSGTVDNLLAKERAAKIAMTVKGVRAVVNDIEVMPMILRTDRDIRLDIEDALLYDPATDSYEINVAVKNNVATLSGTVDSLQEKELCVTVAKGVRGVTAVNDKIKVEWSEKRPDSEIKADVEKALQWDAYVDHVMIQTEVTDGMVHLSGIVGSAAEKRLARIDAYVNGVRAVDDTDLKVEKWARDDDLRDKKYVQKSEDAIRLAVSDALLYDPRVSSFKIDVTVAGSVVTIRGTVDNLKAKLAAAQDARNTVGVRRVKNHIKVKPAMQLSASAIEKKIEDAFLRDPYVSSYEIEVDVIGGVAVLSGTVDSYYEKVQAEDIAAKVSGVLVVDNDLAVRKDYDPYFYDPYVEDRYLDDYGWYRHDFSYPKKSDAEIKEQINDELFWSPFVDADDVTVTVDQGKATLTGVVDSRSESLSAEENAYEGGAVFVDNDLIIGMK
jgi:osmotically-inducible protein OsmY